jgi:hypothetical protein
MKTINVLIATIARPSLQRMLDSLSPQLQEQDCLTLVFDGHNKIPEFNLSNFKCEIKQYFEPIALGYWGHGIRNKYASLLEKRDFVMHADDDNIYFPDAFEKVRKFCLDTETLYISKIFAGNGKIVWNQKLIKEGNIDTASGTIPYNLNLKGFWEHRCGGDGKFYEQISRNYENIIFLDNIIYDMRNI